MDDTTIDEVARQARQSVSQASPGYLGNQLRLDPQGRFAADRAYTGARLGANDVGAALRGAAPTDYSEFASRAAANAPPPSDMGAALRGQSSDTSEVSSRLKAGAPVSTAPAAPRNIPLGTPGGSTSAPAGTMYVGNDGVATGAINPNTQGASAMSKEAQAFLQQRTATAAPVAAPAVSEAAPAATESVAAEGAAAAAPKTMGALARTMGVVRGVAPIITPAIEGAQVLDVAADPRMSKADMIDQAATGAGRWLGAAVGGGVGATVGSVGGPVGTVVGGAAGAAGGYYGADKLVRSIRTAFGLPEQTPFERLQAMRAQGDEVGAGRGKVNPPPAVPASNMQAAGKQSLSAGGAAASSPTASSASTTAPAPRTMAAAAQQAPQYELGKNAVEVIHPGGARYVETFGTNEHGIAVPEGAVPSDVFYGGNVGAYRSAMQKAAQDAMLDPGHTLARQSLANEGELGKARIMAGAPHVIPPRANPLAGVNGQPPELDGSVVTPDINGGPARVQPLGVNRPPLSQARQQALNALRDKKTTPEQAASTMSSYGYGGSFAKDSKGGWLYVPAPQ